MIISSNFEHIISTSTQQAIENACTNIGSIESVMLNWVNENTDKAPIYDVYRDDNSEKYLFSVDTDGDIIGE